MTLLLIGQICDDHIFQVESLTWCIKTGGIPLIKRLKDRFVSKTRSLAKEERGQGLAEYGVLLALIVLVVIAAIIIFGKDLKEAWEDFIKQFNKRKG